MKILFTGGGTGGHFYPIIAVAEEIRAIEKQERLLPIEMFYMSDAPHDANMLLANNIVFVPITAGKLRRYFSLLNIVDVIKAAIGVISATFKLYSIYPDVIFSKGAYASFPVLCAARFLRIPVVIHESDSTPGRTNAWAGKFAARVAVSYPAAAEYFDKKKVAVTGNPVRRDIAAAAARDTATKFFNMTENIPVVFILGGSLGARVINDAILDILPDLVKSAYVIHQIGKANMAETIETVNLMLGDIPEKARYRPFDYLDNLNMSMAAGVATLIITRAGSALFEIAHWGVPSIVIPIASSNGDHQRKNAYAYARAGAATVIEEANLTPHILLAEIKRLLGDSAMLAKMSAGAKAFVTTDAAETIAREILKIALSHEK